VQSFTFLLEAELLPKPKPVTDLWKGDKNVAAFKVLTKAASDRNDLLVSVEEKKGFLC
jgi:hypothetical protein